MCVFYTKPDKIEILYPGSTTIAQDVLPPTAATCFNQVAAHIEKIPAAQVATPSRGDVSNLAVAAGFGAAAVAVGAYFMVPHTKKNKKRALQREESSI